MKKKPKLKPIVKIAAVAIWLLIWQGVAMLIGNQFILATPLQTLITLSKMVAESNFWLSIWGSFYRIAGGFLVAVITAILLAILSYKSKIVKEFLSPPMTVFRAVPVASFTLLLYIALLVAFGSVGILSMIICFMMALPVLYANTLAGLESSDKKMLDMAKVFRIKPHKKFAYLYTYHVLPFFLTGCKVALGLCWKSGVAAELIGQVKNTIGDGLFVAGFRHEMDKVFAWTVMIILVSVLFEFLILGGLRLIKRGLEK